MKPTDILSNEHRVIEQVLDCLEKMIVEAVDATRLEKEPAKQAVDFFRNFADRCHHGKEEVHLFPAMETKGFPRDGGPTGVMLTEHESGRQYVRGMDAAIEAASQGDVEAVKDFAQNGRSYIQLLRAHIEKEDHCLFGMANQAFSEQDQNDLMAIFERVESEEMGADTHTKYLQIADGLAARYGVARRSVGHESGKSCGCGH